MSYLKKVEQQREKSRVTESHRQRDLLLAKMGAMGHRVAGDDRFADVAVGIPEGIPKAPPAERARCGKFGLTLWRCGLPRGHTAICVRRESVTKSMFDAALDAAARGTSISAVSGAVEKKA